MSRRLTLCALLVAALSACGREPVRRIELFDGGVVARTWVSEGVVYRSLFAQSFYFVDAESGAQVQVAGNVVITVLPR